MLSVIDIVGCSVNVVLHSFAPGFVPETERYQQIYQGLETTDQLNQRRFGKQSDYHIYNIKVVPSIKL